MESKELHDRSETGVDHVSETRYLRFETAMLPKEMILYICDFLESEELLSFAEARPKIWEIVVDFNVLRTRELRCFALRKAI